MDWFDRARKASAAERVTRSDNRHAMNTWQELQTITADTATPSDDGSTMNAHWEIAEDGINQRRECRVLTMRCSRA